MDLTDAHRRYVNRETAVSVGINAILSLVACWLVFGRSGQGSIADPQVLARDFLPQAFILSVMSTLLPGAVTRRRIRSGALAPLQGRTSRLPSSLLVRAVVIGAAALVIAGGAALLLTPLLWTGPLSLGSVYAIKVAFGVLLSIPVTRIGLRAALADPGA